MEHIANFVKQTSTSTGTGDFGLTSATGYRDFSTAFGTGGTDVFDYFIRHLDADEWEYGTGHIDSTSGDLVRDTVIDSSNSDSAVNFSSGDKEVVTDIAAERAGLGDPLERKVVSSATANVDFTDSIDGAFDRYKNYKIRMTDVQVDTDQVVIYMRIDAGGGGADFEAGTSDYAYGLFGFSSGHNERTVSSSSDSKIASGSAGTSNQAIGSATGESFHGVFECQDPKNGNTLPKFRLDHWHDLPNGDCIRWQGSGKYLTASTWNAIRLEMSSGNITSGIFELYGIG